MSNQTNTNARILRFLKTRTATVLAVAGGLAAGTTIGAALAFAVSSLL